jgi:hypothetical protein
MNLIVTPEGPDNCRAVFSAEGLPGMHPRDHVVMRHMLGALDRGETIGDIAPYLREYGNVAEVIPEATTSGPRLTILMRRSPKDN